MWNNDCNKTDQREVFVFLLLFDTFFVVHVWIGIRAREIEVEGLKEEDCEWWTASIGLK